MTDQVELVAVEQGGLNAYDTPEQIEALKGLEPTPHIDLQGGVSRDGIPYTARDVKHFLFERRQMRVASQRKAEARARGRAARRARRVGR